MVNAQKNFQICVIFSVIFISLFYYFMNLLWEFFWQNFDKILKF